MNFNILSKRRNVLMGCNYSYSALPLERMLEIMHKMSYNCRLFSRGTSGVDFFFVLLGLGLFCYFTNNGNVLDFYRKRLVRLLPTYFIIITPYWIVRDILLDKKSILSFLSDLLFRTFFSEGMRRCWFIPAIIIYYLLFPMIFIYIFGQCKKRIHLLE